MQENENPPVTETPKSEAKPTATEVFSKVEPGKEVKVEPAKEVKAEETLPAAKPVKPAKKKVAAPAKPVKAKAKSIAKTAKPAKVKAKPAKKKVATLAKPVKKKSANKPTKKKSKAKTKVKAKPAKKLGKTRKSGKRGPKFKHYPEPTMICVKMTPEDMKILTAKAKRYTAGMMSAYVRHAAVHFKLRKGEKIRLKLRA